MNHLQRLISSCIPEKSLESPSKRDPFFMGTRLSKFETERPPIAAPTEKIQSEGDEVQEDLEREARKTYPPSTVFTLREAADAAGVSLSTVERRHKSGKFSNAYRDTETGLGTWLIPIADLVDADLLDSDVIAVDIRAIDLEQTTLRFEAQVAALKAELAARTDEVAFLRGLVTMNARAA